MLNDREQLEELQATHRESAVAPVVEKVLTTAEVAECECPEFCERDHDLD